MKKTRKQYEGRDLAEVFANLLYAIGSIYEVPEFNAPFFYVAYTSGRVQEVAEMCEKSRDAILRAHNERATLKAPPLKARTPA